MTPLVDRLPTGLPAEVRASLAGLADTYQEVAAIAEGAQVASLEDLLAAAPPIPRAGDLLAPALATLDALVNALPADLEAVTDEVAGGLAAMQAAVEELGSELAPLAAALDAVAPVIAQADLLESWGGRMAQLTTELEQRLNGLEGAGLVQWLERLSSLREELLPALPMIPWLGALEAQLETLRTWLTLPGGELSEHFGSQIQALATTMPARFEGLNEQALQALPTVETLAVELDLGNLFTVYDSVLGAIEAVTDPSTLGEQQAATLAAELEERREELETAAGRVAAAAAAAGAQLRTFDAELYVRQLLKIWSELLEGVDPRRPRPFAAACRGLGKLLDSLSLETSTVLIGQAGERIDEWLSKLDTDRLRASLESAGQAIGEAVAVADRSLVALTTTLSGLVADLEAGLGRLDRELDELRSGLAQTLADLKSQLGEPGMGSDSFLGRVAELEQESAALLADLETGIDGLAAQDPASWLRELLTEIGQVLAQAQLHDIVEEARTEVEKISAELDGITVEPVFDRVGSEIETLRRRLAELDVTHLSEMQKVALRAAFEILRGIELHDDVSSVVRGELGELLEKASLQPLRDAVDLVPERLRCFEPAAVAEQLAAPYGRLKKGLTELEPALHFAVLREVSAELEGRLAMLAPERLTAPILDLFGRIESALEAIEPTALMAPLEKRRTALVESFETLDGERLLQQADALVQAADALRRRLPGMDKLGDPGSWDVFEELTFDASSLLEGLESAVDDLLDELVATVGELDMGLLTPALVALDHATTAVGRHLVAPPAVTAVAAVTDMVAEAGLSDRVYDLTRRWREQRRIETWPELLEPVLGSLSPSTLLSVPVARLDELAGDAARTASRLTAGVEVLHRRYAQERARLDDLLPTDTTSESSFRRLLRDGLEQELGEPVKEVLRTIRARRQALEPMLDAVRAVGLKLRRPMAMLDQPAATRQAVVETLGTVGNSLSVLDLRLPQDQLGDRVGDLRARLAAAKTALLGPQATALSDTLELLSGRLQGIYPEELAQDFETLREKLQTLDPEKVLTQALEEEYGLLLEQLAELDVDSILASMTDRLQALEQEVDQGLERTERAFDGLLAALPL